MQFGFTNRSLRLHRAQPAPDLKWDSVYPGGMAASTWREAKGGVWGHLALKTTAVAGSSRVPEKFTWAGVGEPMGGSAGQARPAVSPQDLPMAQDLSLH